MLQIPELLAPAGDLEGAGFAAEQGDSVDGTGVEPVGTEHFLQ